MLKIKALFVIGETKIYNGQPARDLGIKVEKSLEEALKNIPAEAIVDIKVNTQFVGIGGDQAFILIVYKEPENKYVETKVAKK